MEQSNERRGFFFFFKRTCGSKTSQTPPRFGMFFVRQIHWLWPTQPDMAGLNWGQNIIKIFFLLGKI